MRNDCLSAVAAILFTSGATNAAADCYVPDVAGSSLRFTAMQRGEPFEGTFRDFDGTLCLDRADPGTGRIELRVKTGSVATALPEADQALQSALFLDAATHPDAVFTSSVIRANGVDRFEVNGTLSLREGTRELTVPFTFRPVAGEAAWMLEGETLIRRLDYGVGIGEWLDTNFLDDVVRLHFVVKLRPVP